MAWVKWGPNAGIVLTFLAFMPSMPSSLGAVTTASTLGVALVMTEEGGIFDAGGILSTSLDLGIVDSTAWSQENPIDVIRASHQETFRKHLGRHTLMNSMYLSWKTNATACTMLDCSMQAYPQETSSKKKVDVLD